MGNDNRRKIMARVVGDTGKIRDGKSRSRYIRVCTETSNSRVYLKKFDGSRHAVGSGEFSIHEEQLSSLINLLLRAEKAMDRRSNGS